MGITETLVVTVTGGEPSVTGITLDQTSAYVKKGETITLTATAPTGSEITWSSSDEAVAAVAGGVVTAKAAGTATITATMTGEGEPKTATCVVTVYESVAEPNYTVTITPQAVSIIDGGTTKLTAEVSPSEGEYAVEWTSSNSAVATVDECIKAFEETIEEKK